MLLQPGEEDVPVPYVRCYAACVAGGEPCCCRVHLLGMGLTPCAAEESNPRAVQGLKIHLQCLQHGVHETEPRGELQKWLLACRDEL